MTTELAVQKWLREKGGNSPAVTLDVLQAAYSLKVATHPELPLVVLNYDQCESKPKSHPIVRECRALTLELGTWNVVARAFPRFFAVGEVPDCDKVFDWAAPLVQEKHDGSLVLAYKYGGKLFVNTRGSFGTGPIQKGHPLTWHDVFFTALAIPQSHDMRNAGVWNMSDARDKLAAHLPEGKTAVFELCSPYNVIVRKYDRPTAYLLSVFDNATGREYSPALADDTAHAVGAARPETFDAGSMADLNRLLAAHPDPTFEGFVVTDSTLRRKKVKSPRYEALHRVKCGVEPALSPKTFAPFLAHGGDKAELFAHLDDRGQAHYHTASVLTGLVRNGLDQLWDEHRETVDQKAFALAVSGSPARSMLFEARKRKCHPRDVWAERSVNFLTGHFEGLVPRGVPSAEGDPEATAAGLTV